MLVTEVLMLDIGRPKSEVGCLKSEAGSRMS